MKKKRKYFKSKFMFNHKRKHPAWVFDEINNSYKFVGITHARKTKGSLNLELPENPEFGQKEKSYIRPLPMIDPKNVFSKNKKDFRMTKKNRYWFYKHKKKKPITSN